MFGVAEIEYLTATDTFDAALAQVARNTTGPLAQECARVLQEMQIGKSRIEAFQAGATGYISKGAPRAEIVDEIDRVLRSYPALADDAFVAAHRDAWLAP